jgi:hypothetical protein
MNHLAVLLLCTALGDSIVQLSTATAELAITCRKSGTVIRIPDGINVKLVLDNALEFLTIT